MQREVAGYSFGRALRESDGLVTYGVEYLKTGERFLATGSSHEFSALSEVAALQNELELFREWRGEASRVLRPIHRIDDSRNSYLVYEFFGGPPLEAQSCTRWEAAHIVAFARCLLLGIDSCHAHGIVHCRITPRAILWDDQTQELRLTGFGSARSSHDASRESDVASLTPFSAPEQTGHLAAKVDGRSDLYAAGAVLYWVLTGQAPFEDGLGKGELAYSLVAKSPAALRERRPDLPVALGEYVMGLLAKSPAERFCSVAEALEALDVLAPQVSGKRDSSARPPHPLGSPKLHGRERDYALLRSALDEAAAGSMRVALVSGVPGSGKSRLTEELLASLERNRYLVACGKFEQYRHQRPYSALLTAMSDLFDVFLSASDTTLAYWHERFERIDAALRAVLAEQLPQLHHIVGQHEPPPRLGPAETQNRFQQAFRALLEALCAPRHPLVLAIDDLQWSDDETLALLGESFTSNRGACLLLLLSYRSREAVEHPRLMEFVRQHTRPSDDSALEIRLEQLSQAEVAAICSDLVSPCEDMAALHRIVQARCHGNPLFALEIIKHLRQTGRLQWGAGGTWRLRPTLGPAVAAVDNVVDFIVSRIHALPHESRRVVLAASCLGHVFDAAALQLVTAFSEEVLCEALAAALAEGLIRPEPEEAAAGLPHEIRAGGGSAAKFRFVHDRIQQAARSMCDRPERDRIHLVIGRVAAESAARSQTALFEAVDHLNEVDGLLEPSEKLRLAELDLRAGRAAKEIIAYQTATLLFEKVLSLVPPDAVEARRLRFEAELNLAESLYLGSALDRAEAMFESALKGASGAAEEVEVHRTRLVLYQHQQRYAEAINLGLRALAILGVRLPEHPSAPRLATSLALTMLRMRAANSETLLGAPDRSNDVDRTVLDLLVLLWTPSFWINQQLNALVVLGMIETTRRLGNTAQAPMAYVCFGILNHVLFRRHERGVAFGKLAVELLSRRREPFIASRVRFLSLTFFGSLERDTRANVEAYESALTQCLGSGEHVFAGHTLDGITTSLPIHGFRVPEIERRLGECRAIAERIGSASSVELIGVIKAWCRALADGVDAPEASVSINELRFDSCVGVHRMLRMATLYLWDDDGGVLQLYRTLRGNVVVQSNPLHASFYTLFGVLSLCRSARRVSRRATQKMVGKIAKFEQIFPPNFRSIVLLARAEIARRHAGDGEALDFYHRAIAEASERGHDLFHAIACERLASLYEARGHVRESQEYLRIAAYGYGRFGASAKVEQLGRKHPGVDFGQVAVVPDPGNRPIDLRAEAVMRSAYAIAEESHSDRLAHNLLRVVTTAAGAQRAFLVKANGLKWHILAGWPSDPREGDFDGVALEGSNLLSEAVVRYAARTKTTVHIHEPNDPRFKEDPYLVETRPRATLCLPLLHRGELLAVLYLENSVCADVFTDDQRQLALMLGHQAAIAMATADYHKVQVDALQAKINPHFLHNALSVIAELVVTQPAKAEAAVLKLSKLYRYVLNSTADQVVSLEQELAIARDYVALEQYRFGDRLQVEFHVEGPVGEVSVPALLLQPLVENAIRHGVSRKVGIGVVRVTVTVEPGECSLCVADDGPGWREERPGGGFGLKSVLDRLRLLYRDGFHLSIEKGPGVTIQVRFPLEVAPSGRRRVVNELASGLPGQRPGLTEALPPNPRQRPPMVGN